MEFSVFHFVSIASRPASGHLWEDPSCIIFTPSQKGIYTSQ